jgi:hypothetical protein
MKLLVILVGSILMCSGCATSSIHILEKKEPTRPYTKILAIYLEEGCEFSMLDSTTYNICIRSCFMKTDTEALALRKRVEDHIALNLSTSGTTVLKSADLFDTVTNSYADFEKTIDNLAIDALLIVDARGFLHNEQHSPGTFAPNYTYSHGAGYNATSYTSTPGTTYTTVNGSFESLLINTKSIAFPVWRAILETKGTPYNGKRGLNRSMASKIAQSLKSSGYIAH